MHFALYFSALLISFSRRKDFFLPFFAHSLSRAPASPFTWPTTFFPMGCCDFYLQCPSGKSFSPLRFSLFSDFRRRFFAFLFPFSAVFSCSVPLFANFLKAALRLGTPSSGRRPRKFVRKCVQISFRPLSQIFFISV